MGGFEMEREELERKIRIVRNIANGLMIWRIIGIVLSIIAVLFLISFTSMVLQSGALSSPELSEPKTLFSIAGIMLLVSLMLSIVECVMYRNIKKSARQEELPAVSYFYTIFGIHAYSFIVMIASNFIMSTDFDITTIIMSLIELAFVIWMFVEYLTWKKALES